MIAGWGGGWQGGLRGPQRGGSEGGVPVPQFPHPRVGQHPGELGGDQGEPGDVGGGLGGPGGAGGSRAHGSQVWPGPPGMGKPSWGA